MARGVTIEIIVSKPTFKAKHGLYIKQAILALLLRIRKCNKCVHGKGIIYKDFSSSIYRALKLNQNKIHNRETTATLIEKHNGKVLNFSTANNMQRGRKLR